MTTRPRLRQIYSKKDIEDMIDTLYGQARYTNSREEGEDERDKHQYKAAQMLQQMLARGKP